MNSLTRQYCDTLDLICLCKLCLENTKSLPRSFTSLFNQGVICLSLSDADAAKAFDVSIPIIRRWKSGKVIPPSAPLVINFLIKQLGYKSKQLKSDLSNPGMLLEEVVKLRQEINSIKDELLGIKQDIRNMNPYND